MGRPVTNWSFLPPPTKRQIFPLLSVATNIAAFPLRDRFINQPGIRQLIVVLLNFLTRIDGPIRPAHCDSARVSNPPPAELRPKNVPYQTKPPLDRPEESDHNRTPERWIWCCGGAAAAVLFYCTHSLRRRHGCMMIGCTFCKYE